MRLDDVAQIGNLNAQNIWLRRSFYDKLVAFGFGTIYLVILGRPHGGGNQAQRDA